MNPNGKYNDGFWGQECGPEKDPTPEKRYKYIEDAISVNTGYYHFFLIFLIFFPII